MSDTEFDKTEAMPDRIWARFIATLIHYCGIPFFAVASIGLASTLYRDFYSTFDTDDERLKSLLTGLAVSGIFFLAGAFSRLVSRVFKRFVFLPGDWYVQLQEGLSRNTTNSVLEAAKVLVDIPLEEKSSCLAAAKAHISLAMYGGKDSGWEKSLACIERAQTYGDIEPKSRLDHALTLHRLGRNTEALGICQGIDLDREGLQ